MARYEYVEGTSSKFWEIEKRGSTVTVRWGRIGAAGRNEKSYELASPAEATKRYDKLVAEKTAKGYALVGDATKAKAKPATDAPAWLAKVKPTKTVAAKGRTHDVTGDPVNVDLAKVEKQLGLPLGPVFRDLVALCQAVYPQSPAEAFAKLGPLSMLTFDVYFSPSKKIGYGEHRKSLRTFATDHKNSVHFYLSGTTSDDCPVVYEDLSQGAEPEIVASDLATYLSQLAFDEPSEARLAANLRLLPHVTKQLAKAELPAEYEDIDFDEKPGKAVASARADAAAASAPLAVGGATVSAKDLAKAQKLLEKGGILASGSDAKKLGFVKEALAIVGGATEGEAAALRLEVEKDLVSKLQFSESKESKALAERLLVEWTERGVTDAEGWKDLAAMAGSTSAKVPAKQVAAVRRAWANATLTDYIGDQQSKPRPPKETKAAYNQARVELFHGDFARAHACLPIAKQDEHWGPAAECLEVEILRKEGKAAKAKQLLDQLVARESKGERYNEIQWNYLAAEHVVLDGSAATRAKLLAAWKAGNTTFSSPRIFELA